MPGYKPVNFTPEKWQELRDLADSFSVELGTEISIPKAIDLVVAHYQKNKHKKGIKL